MKTVEHASDETYPALFQSYVVRSADATLARLRAADAQELAELRPTALHCLPYALKLPDAQPAALDITLALAEHMERAGLYAEWAPFLIQGIGVGRRREDVAVKATLQFHLGRLYLLRGQFDAARTLFARSRAGFAHAGDGVGEALALNRLGYIACLSREYAEARQLAEAALARLDADHPERADSLNVLGRTAFYCQDWTKAEEYYTAALAIRREEENSYKIACNLRDLGGVYQQLDRLDNAAACLDEALTRFCELEIPMEEAAVRLNLGNICFLRQDYVRAQQEYEAARHIFLTLRDEFNLAIVYSNLGLTYTEQRAWAQAEQMLKTAIYYRRCVDDRIELVKDYGYLSTLYVHWQQYRCARTAVAEGLRILETVADHPAAPALREALLHAQEANG